MTFLKQNWIKIGIGILILGALFFVFAGDSQNVEQDALLSFKCPDDYKTSAESVAAFEEWADWFFDNNPDASISDMASARQQFYRDNNCEDAIKRFDDYTSGNVAPEVKEVIEEVINEAVE